MKNQTTSLDAYLNNLESLGSRQQTVLKAISTKDAICNQELAKMLGWEINRVTGRVKELREMGHVQEAYRDTYEATGRTVIFWQQKPLKYEQSLMMFVEAE